MDDPFPLFTVLKAGQTAKWKTLNTSEGFFVTTDLSRSELKEVKSRGNWEKYLNEVYKI